MNHLIIRYIVSPELWPILGLILNTYNAPLFGAVAIGAIIVLTNNNLVRFLVHSKKGEY
jgi:hypothetical protein